MKFTGSIIGKIFLILICLILGGVLTVGGIVGGVYFYVNNKKVSDIEDLVNGQTKDTTLNFDEETKNKGLIDWGKDVWAAIGNLFVDGDDATTIGKIEGLIGMTPISDLLNELIGIDREVVRNSALDNLAANITDNLTIGELSEKAGIELPDDIPLFKEPEFLNSNINEAFTKIETFPLEKFVKMSEEETHPVLWALKDLTIDELGGEQLTEKVDGIKISDVIEIDNNSHPVLQSLKDLTVGELGGEKTNDIINTMFLDEIMDIGSDSASVLISLKYSSLKSSIKYLPVAETDESTAEFIGGKDYDATKYDAEKEFLFDADGVAYAPFFDADGNKLVVKEGGKDCYKVFETKLYKGKYRAIRGINEKIDTVTLGDIMDVTPEDGILYTLRNSTLDSLGDDLNELFLCEVMTIDETSSATLKALKYASIKSVTVNVPVTSVIDVFFPEREEPGYVYLYTAGEKAGEVISYVAVMDDATGEKKRVNDGGVDCFVAYKTRVTEGGDGVYRPLQSIDEKITSLFIGEILQVDSSSSLTLKALAASSLESQKVVLEKAVLDAATAAYESSAKYDASLEDVRYEYKYSAGGYAFVLDTEVAGNFDPTVATYTLYKTKLYTDLSVIPNMTKMLPLRGVDDKIKVMTFGEAVEINADSSKLMKSLQHKRIDELDEAISEMFIDEIMTIDEGSSTILKSLRYNTLDPKKADVDLTGATDVTGDGTCEGAGFTFLEKGGVIYAKGRDGKVYATKFYEGKNRPLAGLSAAMDNLTLGEVVTIDENSSKLMTNLRDKRIDELDEAISEMFIDEIMTVDENSTTMLRSIRYSTIDAQKATTDLTGATIVPSEECAGEGFTFLEKDGKVYAQKGGVTYKTRFYDGKHRPLAGLDDAMDGLAICDVFEENKLDNGVLSLIGRETKLNDIPDAFATAMQDTRLAVLKGIGVLDADLDSFKDSQYKQRAFTNNGTLGGIMNGMIDFINTPVTSEGKVNYAVVSPDEVGVSGAYSSISEFVAAYKQFDTLVLSANVTITVDETADAKFIKGGKYYIPVFNIIGFGGDPASGYNSNGSITFVKGGVDVTNDVILTVRDSDGVSAHQYCSVFTTATQMLNYDTSTYEKAGVTKYQMQVSYVFIEAQNTITGVEVATVTER